MNAGRFDLIVDTPRGKDTFKSSTDWEYVLVDGNALRVTQSDGSRTLYAAGAWTRVRKVPA